MGALKRAILRNVKTFPEKFPITDANRSFTTFEGQPLEMVSITGNVSQVEGKTLVHAHMIISKVENEGISVAGGHLVEGCVVYSFAELILAVISDIDMEKFFDEVTQTHQLFRE